MSQAAFFHRLVGLQVVGPNSHGLRTWGIHVINPYKPARCLQVGVPGWSRKSTNPHKNMPRYSASTKHRWLKPDHHHWPLDLTFVAQTNVKSHHDNPTCSQLKKGHVVTLHFLEQIRQETNASEEIRYDWLHTKIEGHISHVAMRTSTSEHVCGLSLRIFFGHKALRKLPPLGVRQP